MKINDLQPLPNNPRKITTKAMDRLKESIQRDPEYMLARPIIADKNGVILGGNQRWRACVELGMDEIPDEWVRRVEWDEEKARRFSLVDNAPAGMAGDWDLDILANDWEVVELEELGFSLKDLKIPGDDGQPPVAEDNYAQQYGVIVMCDDEAHQESVYNFLAEHGYNCKVVNT